ncbi:5-formyltetrahydrofolate cyclo-ligase [Cloacibacterium sp.]|uniref:5-formyltetrahydrofolate cyclo-ligase n=1 Tax=Cloacibacterium sp. TaxID=1913682 RepID=UPI0035B2B809
MLKKDLRKKYLEKRMTLSKDEVNFLSEKILDKFILQFNIIENQKVSIFLPISKFNEINTLEFIKFLWRKKVNVFVPKIIVKDLILVKFTPETILIENSWGILEPLSNQNEETVFDYVITPLLYCDSFGNRVGYGKGFYDKFFQTINSDAKKIGVNYFAPTDIIDDISELDVKLDYLITPDEILSFSGISMLTK